jgi:hypothetical protein
MLHNDQPDPLALDAERRAWARVLLVFYRRGLQLRTERKARDSSASTIPSPDSMPVRRNDLPSSEDAHQGEV